jgi:hypothetical protein
MRAASRYASPKYHGRLGALWKTFVVERQDAKNAKVGKKREEDSLGVAPLGVLGVLAFNPLFNRAASRP